MRTSAAVGAVCLFLVLAALLYVACGQQLRGASPSPSPAPVVRQAGAISSSARYGIGIDTLRRMTVRQAPTPTPTPTPVPPTPTPEPPAPTPIPEPTAPPPLVEVVCASGPQYLSWVWRFSSDGSPDSIAAMLAEHNLGVILKTHDGTDWMAEYDPSPNAVNGPEQVQFLAEYFEGQGVPFHAWAVVKGIDPLREAEMAAQVLAAGARSITLDLEPSQEFWQGTPEAAIAFGQELRRLQPNAVVITAVDPRPWELPGIPLAEFASFSNALAPLIYWDLFDTVGNIEKYGINGWPPGPEGATPEFLLDVTASLLQPHGLPIHPVGSGSSADLDGWTRFLNYAPQVGMSGITVWRHGETDLQVWQLLDDTSSTSGLGYIVQPGDTLAAIAQSYGANLNAVIQANQIADPNLVRVGQELCIPQEV